MTAQPVALWGAFVPGTVDPVPFEQAVGKTMSLFHTGQPWAKGKKSDGTWNYQPFPATYFGQQRLAGRLLLWDWRPWDSTNQKDPAFDLNAVIRGDHDAFLHQWARAAAALGTPFLLKPWTELNGDWYLYGEAVGANPPGAIVPAWRHVHDIFVAEHATNVSWAWCVNIQSLDPKKVTGKPLAYYYPGDDVVDWVFLDGYNQAGSKTPPWPWFSFAQVFGGSSWYQNTYANAAALTSKPIGISEFSSDDRGGSKPLWIADAFAAIPKLFPRIRAVCWTEQSFEAAHWSLTTPLDQASLAVFKAAIASPVYLASGVWTPPDPQPFGAPELEVGPVRPGLAADLALANVGLEQAHAQLTSADTLHTTDTASIDRLLQELSDAQQSTFDVANKLSALEVHIRAVVNA
jgi:hypothetical protein